MSWCKHCVDRGSFFSTNYFCNISGEEVSIPNVYIEDYCKHDYMVSKCPFYQKYGQPSGGCFITTVICDILKKDDHDTVIDGLRKFRDEVLQIDKNQDEVLKEYDVIGPIIVEKILEDKNKEKIAETVYNHVLEPISKMITEGKKEEAIEAYNLMTLMFINYYGMKHEYNGIVDDNYGYNQGEFDQKRSGHGKKNTKKLVKALD